MKSSTTTLTTYALLVLSTIITSVDAAGPHNRFGVGAHRRHHARAAATSTELSTPVQSSEQKRDECELGAWKCVGSVLQRCYNDQWNFVTNCTGTDIICSDGLYTTGCVWTWSVEQNDDANESATSSPPFTSSITVTPTASESSASASTASITNANLAVEPTATATADANEDEECEDEDEQDDQEDDEDEGEEYCDDEDDGAWDEYYSSATAVVTATPTSAASVVTAAPTSAIGGDLAPSDDDDEGDDDDEEEECEDDDSDDYDDASPTTTSSASTSATSIIGGQLWAGHGDASSASTHDWYSWGTQATATTEDWNTWDQATSTSEDWNTWAQATASASASATSSRGHGKGKGHKSSSADWAASTSPSWDQSGDVSSTTDEWSTATTTNSWDDWSGQATASSAAWGQSGKGSATASASSSAYSAKPSKGSNHTTGSPSSSYSSAPHYVIYSDYWLFEMPSVDVLSNFNRFILAFWMTDRGAVDNAQFWEQLDSTTRQQVITDYHNAGIALMVSAFGSTDAPTSNGADPTQTAQALAKWVKDYGLDGVDIDYEDMPAMNSAQAVAWIVTFQKELRRLLPSPYIISHAPVAPWFTSANDYSDKAYVAIHEQTGDGIDFYNIQFYNQGSGVYEDCYSLLFDSGNDWPSTSVFEINSSAGLPLDKIVIGKPLDEGAAANGFIDASLLAKCVSQAQAKGWNAGVMFWEWTTVSPAVPS
uniref:GH18 domain-containing protein n=1 Tax=Kwoniella bestiolae CBS 10118 TaxID=1296100 RepID=A0A1B9FU42_9TREE|nr:hypothetical protein I302_07931 [Kwoniella bestiolae CBS 10118]OCF22286.1 hypothetical protein I302_07931 [Kwoniella bestiolae CBS 10118]